MKKTAANWVILSLVILSLTLIPFINPQLAKADGWDIWEDSTPESPLGEIIGARTENSKTSYLGNNKYSLDSRIGVIHYKDDYNNPSEQWKNIDTTIVNGRIDKAPYILEIDYDKKSITVTDKRTSSFAILTLQTIGDKLPSHTVLPTVSNSKASWEGIASETDLEVVASNSRVSFTRVLNDNTAPLQAKYDILQVGDGITIRALARDAEGEPIPVQSSIKDGVLTETIASADLLGKSYPIRIDPTVDVRVAASLNDCQVRDDTGAWDFNGTYYRQPAGWNDAGYAKRGGGMRFLAIAISQELTITTAYVVFTSGGMSSSGLEQNTVLTGEAVDDAAVFSNLANYQGRRGTVVGGANDNNITTANVTWDAIPQWIGDTTYNSPEIKTVIQEIVDRGGWSSGNDMVIFWDDHADRSTHTVAGGRDAYSWDSDSDKAPLLHIEYSTPQPTVTTSAETNTEVDSVTLNGEITDVGTCNATCRGFEWGITSNVTMPEIGDEPLTPAYTSNWTECKAGNYTAEAFSSYGNITGLSTGTTYYYRAYAHNYIGWGYSAEDSFLTKLAAPTNVSATDAGHTDKVVVTWNKSTGATDYQVYRGAVALGWAGDVATYDDNGAGAPTVTQGNAAASDGTSQAHVTLDVTGQSANVGAVAAYKVVAKNATGESADSATDNGNRGVGGLTYAWYRSAADSDAAYGSIVGEGGTTDPYDDTNAPASGEGRWYYCKVSATGAVTQDTPHDRGYREAYPTVVSCNASAVEVTTATYCGNVTYLGSSNVTCRGFEWGTTSNVTMPDSAIEPLTPGYTSNWTECSAANYTAEAFNTFGNVTGLSSGTTYYFRVYASNNEGWGYSGEDWFLTKPAAPTNISATDGAHTDRVVITWTQSVGGTGYQVYRDGVGLGWIGDVATYDDNAADAPIVTPGNAAASDGTSLAHVTLSLAGENGNNGTNHVYKVKARNDTGESVDSVTDTGYRGFGALTYQWQRSAANSDAAYGNIAGGTTDPYNDIGAPADGSRRYFKCSVDADGAASEDSTANQGFRDFIPPPPPPDPGIAASNSTMNEVVRAGIVIVYIIGIVILMFIVISAVSSSAVAVMIVVLLIGAMGLIGANIIQKAFGG